MDLKFRGSYLSDNSYSKGRGYNPVFDVFICETDQVHLMAEITLQCE